jgi:beta-phosphoglucomutase
MKNEKLPKFEAVVFDLDGVLVRTDYYHFLAWRETAGELGVHFDEKVNMRLRGVSRRECLEILLENYKGPPLSEAGKTQITDAKNARYRELLKDMGPKDVSPEVLDLLEALKKAGVKLAIGSSSKNAGLILEKTGLKKFFDAVSDGNNISASKPDPEVFLKAASLLGVEPAKALVVEDAVSGIEAAVRGGFFSCAVGDAVNHERADYKVQSMGEIKALILFPAF